jgi:malate dehydrogenase
MKRVSIVGSGNVGTNAAFFLAENRVASVTLVDVKDGIATGKALDMMEAGPLRGYQTDITGTTDIGRIERSDVVVLAAGRVRRPGETRADLLPDNLLVTRQVCEQVQRLAPQAVVVNVVEPVDLLTLLAQEALGFDRARVLGVGGLLTSTRLRYMVSHALGVSPREVTALVVGAHYQNMVFLKDSIRVSGLPATTLIDEEHVDQLIEEARKAGDTILELAQRSTAYYGPSAATASLVEAIVRDTRALLPVSVRLDGEYGIKDLALSVPAYVGAGGADRIVEVDMKDGERRAFDRAAAELRAALDKVPGRGK